MTSTPVEGGVQVRFSPRQEPGSELAKELLERVPDSTWDQGLGRATSLLAAGAQDRRGRVSPQAAMQAKALAGYPGDARFLLELNGGAFPERIVEEMVSLALARSQPVDVALARRDYGDGLTLWVGGVAQRPVLLDPIPRDLSLDQPLPITVEPLVDQAELLLFVATPDGPVLQRELTPLVAQWLDVFHVPGPYRLEVVGERGREAQVLLLWTEFVGVEPGDPPRLSTLPEQPPDPMQATEALYAALDSLRAQAGLHPLARFAPYEPLAREHAALMASSGTLAHVLPGLTDGVPKRSERSFRPTALHHENLAAAYSWDEARDFVELSPGHRANLLCESCTHAAIGVALEPVADRPPRLFVAWELLEFPSGVPQPR